MASVGKDIGPKHGWWEEVATPVRGGVGRSVIYTLTARTLEQTVELGQEPVMISPRHNTFATPMLILDLNHVAAILLAKEIGAQLHDIASTTIPMSVQTSTAVTFQIRGTTLQLRRRSQSRELMMSVAITDKFAYFLSMTNNVSINIRAGKRHWFVTVVDQVHWQIPQVAVHSGPVNEGVMAHSIGWEAVYPGPSGLLIGDIDDDMWTWTYRASRAENNDNKPKPNSLRRDTCARCGVKAELNREHCTPKWLTDLLRVEPVVGRILCEPCNTAFGKQFEKPISDLYAAGRFRDPDVQELIYRWAIKTALTLAAMSNIEYPSWLWKVVDGHRAPPTLHMFHILVPAPPDPGYVYTVTVFPRSMREAFAFTFTFDDQMFVIVNSPEHAEPLYDFVKDRRDEEPVHECAIRHYFGVELERGPAQLYPSTRR